MSTQYEQIPPWRREFLKKRQRAQEMERLRLESEAEKLASVPSWKRGLLEKKKQQMNSVVYTDTEGKGSTTNGYGNHSIEKEEHLLPVNQNPWVRSDTKIKHSNQPAKNCNIIPNNFNDSVFDDSESIEVEYGAGFVHKILQKFSHMSTNDSHPKRSHSTDSLDDRKAESKRRIQSERTDCVDQESNKLPSKSVSVESLSSLAKSPGRVSQSPLICRSSNKGSIPEHERPKKNIVKSALSKFQTDPTSPPPLTYTKRSAPLPPSLIINKSDPVGKQNGFSSSNHSNTPCSQESSQNSLDNNANIPSPRRDKYDESLQNVMNNSTEIIVKDTTEIKEIKEEPAPREPTKPAKQKPSKSQKTIEYDSVNERTDRSHLILNIPHRNSDNSKNSTNKGGKPGKFSFGAASNVVPKTYNKQVLQTHLTRYEDKKEKNDEIRTLEDYKPQVDPNEYENLQTNIDDITSDDDYDIPVTNIDDILPENGVDFVGANVKLNRSLLEKTKKPGSLRISFNDKEDIYEYPSEASVYQPEPIKPIKPRKTFADNPALRSNSSGTLGSYVSSTQVEYVMGQRMPENQPIQSNKKKEEETPRQQESLDHSWSESRNSHLLF